MGKIHRRQKDKMNKKEQSIIVLFDAEKWFVSIFPPLFALSFFIVPDDGGFFSNID